jgi:hypothetical protein
VPLAFHEIFSKLLAFIEKHNLQLEYHMKTMPSTGVKTKLPEAYTADDMLAIDTYTIKDGIMVKKMSAAHPDMQLRKLIIANKASFAGAFIDAGHLGLTGNHKFYILGENLELIHTLLTFKIISVVCHYTKYGQDFLDNYAFTFIPDIRKLGIADITESAFYELIGLTLEEITTMSKTHN